MIIKCLSWFALLLTVHSKAPTFSQFKVASGFSHANWRNSGNMCVRKYIDDIYEGEFLSVLKDPCTLRKRLNV